jgi:hypothetical protein
MLKNKENSLVYTLIILLIIASFYSIYLYGVNVPHWDDHAIRTFVDGFTLKKSFHILDFHNEHRIAWTRTIALFSNAIFGELNFKYLMYFGQFGLMALLATYIPLLKKQSLPLLIIALFVLNFSTFENSLWGMAALQNHWVMFFAIGALVSLSSSIFRSPIHVYIATVFSVLALFTSGNGVLVGPLGIMLLFFKGEKKLLKYWAIFHVVLLSLYFIGFSGGGNEKPNIEDFFLNFFALTGSFIYPIFGAIFTIKFSYIFGILNLIITLLVFLRLFVNKEENNRILAFLGIQGFLIGTLALIAFSRNDYEVLNLLSSKYKIYSFLILGTNFFIGLDLLRSKKWRISIIAFSVFLFINAQISFAESLNETRQSRVSDTLNLRLKETNYDSSSYQLPLFGFENNLNLEDAIVESSKIDSLAFGKGELMFFSSNMTLDTDNYIFLKAKEEKYILELKKSSTAHYNGVGKLDLRNFKNGIYQVYLLEIGNESVNLFDTQKTVRIKGQEFKEAEKNW